MDEEEDEDNSPNTCGQTCEEHLVIIKSNMWKFGRRSRFRMNSKIFEKFFIILFVLICSNFRLSCAENIDLSNSSRFRSDSVSELHFEELGEFSQAPVLQRRIRHDTLKGMTNKRLITLKSESSNSVPEFVDLVKNFSVEHVRDDSFDGENTDDNDDLYAGDFSSEKMNSLVHNITDFIDFSAQVHNKTCSCFVGREKAPKISRASHDLTISVQHHKLDTSKGVIAGIMYQVKILPIGKLRELFVSSEDINGFPVGVFFPPHKLCSPNAVQFYSNNLNDSQVLLNWSLPTKIRNSSLSYVVFRLCYELAEHNHTAYEATYNFPVLKGCEYHVWPQKGSLSSTDLYSNQDNFSNCSIIFSNVQNMSENSSKQGLIIKLTRLNIKCDEGNITFSFNTSALLCGKLEEIPPVDREYYFPPAKNQPRLVVVGKPVFAIMYELVDFCYNVTLSAQNDSVVMNPLLKIFCNYQISLPYGYRVDISISIKPNIFLKHKNASMSVLSTSANVTTEENHEFSPISVSAADPICDGIFLRYWDGNKSSIFCVSGTTAVQNYYFRFKSDENQIRFRICSQVENNTSFYLRYEAFEVSDIVRGCPFSSVSINSFCVTVVDKMKLDWMKAEEECVRRGGHLASILDEQSQNLVDQLLLKSPGYQDYNSYWIGASDIGQEGEYRWANSLPFSYTNWFNGWSLYGYYNRQPNDDGFSSQDCVELRRQYHISPAGINTKGSKIRLTPSFTWNDRDCHTDNYFLCEFQRIPESSLGHLPDMRKQECNQKLILNEDNDRAVISSPNFPHNYLDNKNCFIYLTAPPTHKIVIAFEEFVLEDEPNCSYDYLEIYENSLNSTNTTENIRRYCGDWSDKLKLLRYVSRGSKLHLRFVSDYSHSFSGYKAHVSIEQVKTECPDNRLQLFNGSCYLFVSYPQVTWQTAQDICSGVQGNLASVHSLEEEHFIVAKIRESHEYTTSTIYWLGGKYNSYEDWKWVDNTSILFNAWVPMKTHLKPTKNSKIDACLGIQWIPSPSSLLPSGLYWVPISCQKIGGYVCKIQNRQNKTNLNLNTTFNGTEGEFTTPNFPGNYYHNLDYWVTIIGPENTRIIIQFHAFDLEDQKKCLYDYLEIYNASIGISKMESVKYCGHHLPNSLHWLNFVSSKNEAALRFHSDFSIAGSGFSASWKAVDISGCPIQTLTAKEGVVTSPNYPHFLLANLQCTTTILAPVGRQIWFEITDWDFDKKHGLEENTITDSDLYLFLSNKRKLYPLRDANVLTDGVYLSYGEFMRIYLKTGDAPNGRGFKGTYKTISKLSEARVIYLGNNSIGNIYHLNFPLNPVPGLNFVQRFVAPLGYSIHVQFHQVVPSSLGIKGQTLCPENENKSFIEVRDYYADRNGTWWQFCEAGHDEVSHLAITSYLNSITIKQISDSSKKGVLLNASLTVIPDPNFKMKILQFPQNYVVESCVPNPCYNNGKCISDEVTKRCECANHFTGLFCALTICDMNPCVFGVCELTSDFFRCNCQSGYQGQLCDKKVRPCSVNPCQGRGDCIEKNNFTFVCQCHAWWEGERCDKKIANIPYKPLTDRMLQEPFWLGLLTVFIVLSIIGLVWCARRHFPEKLEKLLAEEAERNRPYVPSGRAAGGRGEMQGQNGMATAVNVSQTTTANSSPNPKTFLERIGIRKPSLISLSSPSQPTHTARTFSLDDLYKPSPSRSQMSHKHRNISSYRKKSMDKAFLKRQSSSVDENRIERERKIETVELKENVVHKSNQEGVTEETSFTIPMIEKSDKNPAFNNKFERKVHFARLMSKVQAEISSCSNVEVGTMKEKDNEMQITTKKPLTASAQTLIYQPKSPHSTSSNQGSDSLSSSEMTLISASGEKLNSRRASLLTLETNGRWQKAASADSLLAMFRKYPLSAGPSSDCNSNFVSASTSPTISSPQDDFVGSDDSSLSSYHITPGGVTESPSKLHSSTIQIAVVDPLNSQKQNSNIASSNLLHPPTILLEVQNKLSPIHEVPTPSPSPSMTPIMSRHYRNNRTSNFQRAAELETNRKNDDRVPSTTAMSTLPVGTTFEPHSLTTSANNPDIVITALTESSRTDDSTRSTGHIEHVIPVFTIQESSPVDEAPTIVLCPGTPPPNKDLCIQLEKMKDDKPSTNSDLCSPPIIRVTYSGDIDSDTDCSANKCGNNASNTMSYLSPFSMCSRADRTTSESNLSSSGYSSMASPGPSRCGSSNPLCPLDGDDHGGPSHHSPRRPSPLLRTPLGVDKNETHAAGQPSDSETLSDDHQMESNDEGFSTDQLDEKIKEGEVKSAKELELFIENEQEKKSLLLKCFDQNDFEPELNFLLVSTSANKYAKLKFCAGSDQNLNSFKKLSSFAAIRKQSNSTGELLPNKNEKCSKSSLQLPSIVVDTDVCFNESRSAVSSRSESPLSDRTAGLGRFSPMFYGRLTDSDGIYDWTSSDCLRPIHRKHFGRRRERHRSKSPNVKPRLNSPVLLDVPGKVPLDKFRKPSPKRRFRSHQLIKASSSSSCSSESTGSRSKMCPRKSASPHKIRYLSKRSSCSMTDEVSTDDGAEAFVCG